MKGLLFCVTVNRSHGTTRRISRKETLYRRCRKSVFRDEAASRSKALLQVLSQRENVARTRVSTVERDQEDLGWGEDFRSHLHMCRVGLLPLHVSSVPGGIEGDQPHFYRTIRLSRIRLFHPRREGSYLRSQRRSASTDQRWETPLRYLSSRGGFSGIERNTTRGRFREG